MTGQIHDYPTRVLVNSESDGFDAYLVDLCAYKVGGVFNGSCLCKHFIFKLEPRLKEIGNTSIYRCKHIRWARENVIDFLLPVMQKNDPNISEHLQT